MSPIELEPSPDSPARRASSALLSGRCSGFGFRPTRPEYTRFSPRPTGSTRCPLTIVLAVLSTGTNHGLTPSLRSSSPGMAPLAPLFDSTGLREH
jgi:hypothetical protein